MARWTTSIHLTGTTLKVLVTDEDGSDLMRARLPRRCDHPRALLTLLEGLALWSGNPLTAVISAAGRGQIYEPLLFGGDICPADSALVRLEFLELDRPRIRLRGLGSFRDVLQAHHRIQR